MEKDTNDVTELHSQDDPARRVGVSSSDSGVAIWVGDEVKLRLSWEQKRMLETLLYFEVDPGQFGDLTDEAEPEQPVGTTPQERATASADRIFADTGLDRDEPGMEEAYQAVADWFSAGDEATRPVKQDDDDCT